MLNDKSFEDYSAAFGFITDPKVYDYKLWSYDTALQPYDKENAELSTAVEAFAKVRRNLNRYSRLKPDRFRPMKNAIMMYCPPDSGIGYLLANDQRFWNFQHDVREELLKAVKPNEIDLVNLLLVNYAKIYPVYTHIYPNKMYKVDSRYYDPVLMKAACSVYTMFEKRSLYEVRAENLHQKAKPLTAMGFPYERLDGSPVDRESVMWGREIDEPFARTRFRRDESKVKLEWLSSPDGCHRIFERQLEFLGKEITPENIAHLMDNNLISVVNQARRSNNPDTPKLAHPYIKGEVIGCKDRNFSIFEPGGLRIGTLNSLSFNRILRYADHMPGCANRPRWIYPANNVMHYIPTVLATATLHNVEKGPSGMPSNKPEVMARWRRFCDRFEDTHDIYILRADCQNAELTVTSNFDIIMSLIPEEVRAYLDLTACTVQPTVIGLVATRHAYCSAVWFTTWVHVHKGNFEGIRLILEGIKALALTLPSQERIVTEHLECLMGGTDWADFGDLVTCPFLGTDDIMFPFGIKKGKGVPTLNQDMLKATMMNATISNEPQIGFGMRGDVHELVENISSRISKLWTSEHMGFTFKDGMSTYERLHSCGYTEVIDPVLKKHFGFGHESYAYCVTLFRDFLASLGVNFSDVINEYSPVEKLIYGDLVTGDPINDSKAIPLDIVESMLDDAKQLMRMI